MLTLDAGYRSTEQERVLHWGQRDRFYPWLYETEIFR